MPQVIYAGGELDSVQILTGSPVEIGSATAPYARAGIFCTNNTACIRVAFVDDGGAALSVVAGETLFVHCERRMNNIVTTAGHLMCCIRDSSGDPWVSIQPDGAGNLRLYGNTGSGASPTWTQIGSDIAFSAATYTDDIRVAIAADGVHTVEWIITNTTVALGMFTNTSFTNARYVDWRGFPFGAGITYGQLLCTEGISTVDGHVWTSILSGAGATSDWTGAYTDANETPLSDSTSLSTSTADQTSTFACADITTPANYYLPCVFVWTRGKNSGASPENIHTVFRIDGVDYASDPLANTGVSYTNQPTRYDLAPSGDAWTDTIFNAAERGVKSSA